MVNLDATAGNRMMWKWRSTGPKDTGYIIIDKRCLELAVRPDIRCVWEYLPFRDDAFDIVLFDPPHMVRHGEYKGIYDMVYKYGVWKRKGDIVPALFKAVREFNRVGRRLIFKWYEDSITLWALYSIFRGLWVEVHRVKRQSRGIGKKIVWWVVFTRA